MNLLLLPIWKILFNLIIKRIYLRKLVCCKKDKRTIFRKKRKPKENSPLKSKLENDLQVYKNFLTSSYVLKC